jgi:hypothetical protein
LKEVPHALDQKEDAMTPRNRAQEGVLAGGSFSPKPHANRDGFKIRYRKDMLIPSNNVTRHAGVVVAGLVPLPNWSTRNSCKVVIAQ